MVSAGTLPTASHLCQQFSIGVLVLHGQRASVPALGKGPAVQVLQLPVHRLRPRLILPVGQVPAADPIQNVLHLTDGEGGVQNSVGGGGSG